MKFTFIRTIQPEIIGKSIVPSMPEFARPNGVVSETMDYTSAGFSVIEVETLKEFGEFVAVMEAGKEYLCFAVPNDGQTEGEITTRKNDGGDAIAKTRDNFHFAPEPGVLMIDCDGDALDGDQLHSA